MIKEEIIKKIQSLLNDNSGKLSQQFVSDISSQIKQEEEKSLNELTGILNAVENKIKELGNKETVKKFRSKVTENRDLGR